MESRVGNSDISVEIKSSSSRNPKRESSDKFSRLSSESSLRKNSNWLVFAGSEIRLAEFSEYSGDLFLGFSFAGKDELFVFSEVLKTGMFLLLWGIMVCELRRFISLEWISREEVV